MGAGFDSLILAPPRISDGIFDLVVAGRGAFGLDHFLVDPQQRCLAGPGSTADEQRLPADNLLLQEVGEMPRQCPPSDEVIDA